MTELEEKILNIPLSHITVTGRIKELAIDETK
jgi:hypothetical protein